MPKPLHDKIGYDLPHTKVMRGTSFGFGDRSDLQMFKKGILFLLIVID